MGGCRDEVVNRDAEPPPGDFYVTVREAGRTAWLLGPYDDVRDALADVDRARGLLLEHDPWSGFYYFGVARCWVGSRRWTVFNRDGTRRERTAC